MVIVTYVNYIEIITKFEGPFLPKQQAISNLLPATAKWDIWRATIQLRTTIYSPICRKTTTWCCLFEDFGGSRVCGNSIDKSNGFLLEPSISNFSLWGAEGVDILRPTVPKPGCQMISYRGGKWLPGASFLFKQNKKPPLGIFDAQVKVSTWCYVCKFCNPSNRSAATLPRTPAPFVLEDASDTLGWKHEWKWKVTHFWLKGTEKVLSSTFWFTERFIGNMYKAVLFTVRASFFITFNFHALSQSPRFRLGRK